MLRDGRLFLACSGYRWGQSRFLPRTGWTWLQTVQEGGWRESDAVPVEIPATVILDHGRWIKIIQGIRGILVPDEKGWAVVYMICEPSSPYYRVMTRSNRMPVLIDEQL